MKKVHSSPIRAAFDQGQIPRIACFNAAKTPLGVKLSTLLSAMQHFVDDHFAPVWGTPCKLLETTGFIKGAWALVFVDDADVANALAYHDLTPDGLPISKVFVRTILGAGESLSVSASHELAEMLVDPAINLMSTGPDPKAMYCYETADPVEAKRFKVAGVPMTDFVYPAYFESFRKPKSARFDHLGLVRRPFELLAGGYQIVFKNGKWSNLDGGSKAKRKALRREDRRQHRSEYRKTGLSRHSRKSKWGRVVAEF